MGFVCGGGLEDAKKEIMKHFKDSEVAYGPFIDTIVAKSVGKLDTPLHVAAYYLNPYYYFRDTTMIEANSVVMREFFECINLFYSDINIQDVVTRKEWKAYKNVDGLFGRPLAIRQRSTNDEDYNPDPYQKRNRLEEKILNDLVYVHCAGLAHWWSLFHCALVVAGSNQEKGYKKLIF